MTATFDALLERVIAMLQNVETLSALAARIKLAEESSSVEPQLLGRLDRLCDLILPDLLATITPAERAIILADISTVLRQSLAFLDDPSRAAGWHHTDPEVLNNQGKASRIIVRLIEEIAAKDENLKALITSPGHFLDIGTGAGWIAIEAAKSWPEMTVTGIDIWEPSLQLAHENAAASGVADRVSIKKQDLLTLDAETSYSLVWWPSVFMPESVIRDGLPKVFHSIAGGGALVLALEDLPSLPLHRCLAELRLIRMGGHPWEQEDLKTLLLQTGFSNVAAHKFPKVELILMVARKN